MTYGGDLISKATEKKYIGQVGILQSEDSQWLSYWRLGTENIVAFWKQIWGAIPPTPGELVGEEGVIEKAAAENWR